MPAEVQTHRRSRDRLAGVLLAPARVAALINGQGAGFASLASDDPVAVTGNETVRKGLSAESPAVTFGDTRINLDHPPAWPPPAKRRTPSLPALGASSAFTHQKLGRDDTAISCLEDTVRSDPSWKPAPMALERLRHELDDR